jgi:hypothetical protein
MESSTKVNHDRLGNYRMQVINGIAVKNYANPQSTKILVDRKDSELRRKLDQMLQPYIAV